MAICISEPYKGVLAESVTSIMRFDENGLGVSKRMLKFNMLRLTRAFSLLVMWGLTIWV